MKLDFADRLIKNIMRYNELERETLPPNLSKQSLIEHLLSKTEESARILADNNAIMHDLLRPILKNTKEMPADLADELFGLAQKLFSLQLSLDLGLSLEIYEALIDYATERNDIDRKIKNHYGAGICYSQLHERMKYLGNHSLMKIGLEHFLAGAKYKKEYFQIENKETRMYINRCLGNVYMMYLTGSFSDNLEELICNFKKVHAEALEFWTSEEVIKLDPDFPWDAFIANAHQNMTIWISAMRTQPENERDMDLAAKVYDSYTFLSKHDPTSHINRFWPAVRTKYTGIGVAWCAAKISHNEALQGYREILESFDDDDYSEDGSYVNLFVTAATLQHLKFSKVCVDKESKVIIQKMLAYCKNVPSGLNKTMFYRHLSNIVKYFSTSLNHNDYLDIILDFTIYNHLVTYVHSIMVRELSQIIAGHFMKTEPEHFIGLLESKNVKEVLNAKANILDAISLAALCHDLGKIFYVDTVSLSSRGLYHFEFDIIKEHTNAATLFKPDDAKIRLITDAIGGHHFWHDRINGYGSQVCESRLGHGFVVDIISIADSIDAATDPIGRGFSQTKSLQAVLDEIQAGAGTRYNPIIAEALKDFDPIKSLENCLLTRREKLYFEAYKHIRQ